MFSRLVATVEWITTYPRKGTVTCAFAVLDTYLTYYNLSPQGDGNNIIATSRADSIDYNLSP